MMYIPQAWRHLSKKIRKKMGKTISSRYQALDQERKEQLKAKADRYIWTRRRPEILYLAHAKCSSDLPPVLVEIQHNLDPSFMSRAMRYCLAVKWPKTLHFILLDLIFGHKGSSYSTQTRSLNLLTKCRWSRLLLWRISLHNNKSISWL